MDFKEFVSGVSAKIKENPGDYRKVMAPPGDSRHLQDTPGGGNRVYKVHICTSERQNGVKCALSIHFR